MKLNSEMVYIYNYTAFLEKENFLINKLKKTIKKFVFGEINRKRVMLSFFYLASLFKPFQVSNALKTDKEVLYHITYNNELKQIFKKAFSYKDTKPFADIINLNKYSNDDFKHFSEFELSQKGEELIKYEEGSPINKGEPVLTAYKLGDRMVTVGWGHAERTIRSKYKEGQKISYQEAERLFNTDVKYITAGIKRILSKDAPNLKLNQSMFDAIVSIAFNKGITGFKRTHIYKELIKGNYIKAGLEITKDKKTLKKAKRFPGLIGRRKSEQKLYFSSLSDVKI